jgi:hypothetical protein
MYQVDFIVFDEAAKAPETETETAIPLAKSPHAVVCFIGDTNQCRPNRTSTNDDPKYNIILRPNRSHVLPRTERPGHAIRM